MVAQSTALPGDATRRFPLVAVLVVVTTVYGCSAYVNLSLAVINPAHLRFFPPFKPNVNENRNSHLGGEYFSIARSIATGTGFADPFNEPTGPTAWMAPVFPTLLSAILWASDGDQDTVMEVVVSFQVTVLAGSGLLVLCVIWQTTSYVGAGITIVTFLGAVLCHFHLWFQCTHDYWLVLLAIDLLIAGLYWWRPLEHWKTAVGWAIFGGLCALINPVVALAWAVSSAIVDWRQRAVGRLAVVIVVGGLTLAPWVVRNRLCFGHWIPVKSNLAYELYQSQCLQSDGLLQSATLVQHPFVWGSRERREYKVLGEVAFLDHKREQFWQAVSTDPWDFVKRVGDRFLGATVWYVPLDRTEADRRPLVFWLSRLTHPLPFLALLILLATSIKGRLCWAQWPVIWVYVVYLLPYIAVSYYDRYALPLVGVKVLIVIWAADRLLALLLKERKRGEQRGLTLLSANPGQRAATVAASG